MSKYTDYSINNDDRSAIHEASSAEVIVVIQGVSGSINVSVNSPHLKSLSITRKAGDTANNFTLEVLDSIANDLEYNLLASGSGNITIRYRTSMQDYIWAYNGRSNADGFVEQNNEYIEFSGMITKLSSSWINNRNMLKLEGIVGLSVQDMYDRYSFNWNKVPKFDWSAVFSDYKSSGWSADRNEDDSFWERLGDGISTMIGHSTSLWSFVWNIGGTIFNGDLTSKSNSVAGILSSGISMGGEQGAKAKLAYLLDNIRVDAAGNYYVRRDQYSNNAQNPSDSSENNWVKQSGEYIVPMRPSNLCAFICEGGDFSDLLYEDENFEEYKGTSFYNGDDRVSVLDWWWIQLWYKKMGHFDGMGLTVGDFDSTDLVSNDLTQTAQSITDYFEKVLIPVSKETVEKVDKQYETSKDGKYMVITKDIVQYVYSNYMFIVDDNGVASYKRFSATEKYNESPVATYYYYSSPGNTYDTHSVDVEHNPDGFGILQSFSAKLDVLSSMITNGSVSGGDISNINLVYGGKLEDTLVEVDPNDDGNLHVFEDWGKLTTYSQGTIGTSAENYVAFSDVGSVATTLAYEADATIIGCSGLKPLDLIAINVVRGVARDEGYSYRHHTSGKYLVQTIEESIVNGKIVSKLHLVKNAHSVGTTASTGLIDKTRIIKSWVRKTVDSNGSNTITGGIIDSIPYLDESFYDTNNWNNGVPSDKYIVGIDFNDSKTW